MTVCVAVKVHDCIVFSADSASTLSTKDGDGNSQVLNVYNNADKVFNLHRGLPIVAMTCGMGHIGGRSISNLAKEFRYQISDGDDEINKSEYTIEEVARLAHQFFSECYKNANEAPAKGDYMEFWVGGYGASNTHGEIWRNVIADGVSLEPENLVSEDDRQGVYWGGQGQAISRLLLGLDPAFVGAMTETGIKPELAQQLYAVARSKLEATLLDATMPTIDAIRMAEFLVDTTKGFFSLAFGSDIVGGATDTATVTKWEGFKWINRKHFYPEHLNRKDHDHVC